MKSLIVAIFTILSYNIYSQSIITVNPDSNSSANFNSFNDAVAAANPGDILLLHGGDYGNGTLDKQLVIYGPGYFLDQNEETQSNTSSAYFDNFLIQPGSNSPSGSKISGIEFMNIAIVADNIELNKIKQVSINVTNLYLQGTNIKVKQSYIELFGIASNSNVIILENNYIKDFHTVFGNVNEINNLSLKNCVIEKYGTPTVTMSIEGGSMQNNLFLEEELNINLFDNNSNLITNNIFVADLSSLNADQDLINNNIHNVSIDSLFVGLTGNSTDGQWQLSPVSPAIGAGSDGTDIGMFGGSDPYVLSGIPSIPNIHSLEVNEVGTSQGGLEVTIKVNANN